MALIQNTTPSMMGNTRKVDCTIWAVHSRTFNTSLNQN